MRITKLYIKEYKNLKDFHWTLNSDSPIAAIIGKNASGKTNLLTALIHIFCQAFVYCKGGSSSKKNELDFSITYETNYQKEATLLTFKYENGKYYFYQNNDTSLAIRDVNALPDRIFTYYAGESTLFGNIIETYYTTGQNIWELFTYLFVQDNHFLLLSMFASPLPHIHNEILKNQLQLIELKSVSIIIQSPNPLPYKKDKEVPTKDNFWGANDFPKLFDFYKLLKSESIKHKFSKNNCRLVISQDGLKNIMAKFPSEYEFFRLLQESAGLGFIRNIANFSFLKEGVVNPIGFEDLSEGERQRIGLLGAFAIYQGKETLFLLDEPDAFAHPRWQWNFIPDILKEIQGNRDNVTQQVIFATHSPIVLSSLSEPAFMMKDGTITQMNSTFGNTIDETLAEQEVPYREADVSDKLKRYIGLIQGGYAQTTEALELRTLLAEKLGANHSELKDADILISLYE